MVSNCHGTHFIAGTRARYMLRNFLHRSDVISYVACTGRIGARSSGVCVGAMMRTSDPDACLMRMFWYVSCIDAHQTRGDSVFYLTLPSLPPSSRVVLTEYTASPSTITAAMASLGQNIGDKYPAASVVC